MRIPYDMDSGLAPGKERAMKLDAIVALVLTLLIAVPATAVAWEPTKPIEFVVPAGTGGGADQMARLIAGLAEKHKLSPRPLIVVNKSGGAGAEGFLDVKSKKGDAHTIIITLSNLFTTPLHNNLPFNWRDYTPLARMALDEFILWVNAETPYKTAKKYLMLRGIFGTPNMPKDAVDWYVGFLKKISETPEWMKYMEEGALKPAFASGAEYVKWVEENEQLHKDLMAKGGLLKK